MIWWILRITNFQIISVPYTNGSSVQKFDIFNANLSIQMINGSWV
ncbi:unnamed protein product [Paramecium pentaurelia]|uniref:Uncharacterized protein n=1 Tax=Paramecium pentaurelia TaxID=43138 RepID=A0A8S1TGZ4_9CILI|nr:unnamed protein product [Paramecium pentaurelia]